MTEKKRKGWFRWWYIPLALIIVIAVAIGVGGKGGGGGGTPAATTKPGDTAAPQPTPKPDVGAVGERVEKGGIALTVMNVSTVADISGILKPSEGNVYLVVDVLIETTSRDTAPYNPLYFKVKDSGGFEYNTAMAAPDPSLKSGDLAKGDKVRGNVAFEVKKDATGFVLTYEPMVIAGGYEPIKVDLGK